MSESQDRQAYYAQSRPEMAPFVPSSTRRLLDVGCGEGFFGAMMKERLGCEVWGIELDPLAAAQARTRLDRVLEGDLGAVSVQLPEAFFDCVAANDILEHLLEPEQALRTLRRTIVPAGWLVASIPNFRHFENLWSIVVEGEWQYSSAGILDRTHLRFFTEKSIRRLFEEQGYRVEQLTGINRVYSRRGFRHLNRFVNALSLNSLRDTFFLQFAVVARPGASAHSDTQE